MKKDLRKIELLFYPDCSAAKPTSTMVEGVLSGLARVPEKGRTLD
jgi:hypothetical protein